MFFASCCEVQNGRLVLLQQNGVQRTFKASTAQLDTDWPCLNLCPDFFRRNKLLVFIGFKRIKLDLLYKEKRKGNVFARQMVN
jgi:hypothetical protein